MKPIFIRNNFFSILSTIFSCIFFAAIIWINHKLAIQYLSSDGKTKVMFGIIEWSRLDYKFYSALLIILAILFLVKAINRKENRLVLVVSSLFIVISTGMLFVRFWKMMI